MNKTSLVLEAALEVGFDLAGVAPFAPPPAADRFRTWLDRGHHAGMAWLERDRERIADPELVLPGGRSVLVVALGHGRPPASLADGTRVARYAAGRDYHNVAGQRLRKLRRRLGEMGLAERARSVVDAGPVLERSHAARAGLGFESKAANLLHPEHGPWFFLAELLLEDELEPTPAAPAGSCGTCRACLDACPTAAILEPGVVDAGRCISYHTIENRGSVPEELREAVGEWAFGCDVCSEVCPWGREAPDLAQRFGSHPAVEEGRREDWLGLGDAERRERFRGSPLQRPGRAGLARNAALSLGRRPSDEGQGALEAALAGDPSPVVREAAGWALARAHPGARTRAALERALPREQGSEAAGGLRRALDGLA